MAEKSLRSKLTFGGGEFITRPGKSCESFSNGKFIAMQCPQNSVIRDKIQRETFVSNDGVARWNPQILIVYPQFIAIEPQF